MKYLKYSVVCMSLLAAVPGVMQAQPVAAMENAAPQERIAVMKINGKVVHDDALTSLSDQIAQFETGFPPEGPELLDEFVFTNLADQIPTTASIPALPEPSSTPWFSNVMARSHLKSKLREKLNREIEVPREELEAWYEQNKTTYQRPEEVYAWHIFQETSEESETSSPEKVRERLSQVKSQIDSGTSFSLAAEQHSEAASKDKGGLIGRIRPRQPIGPLNKPMNLELEQVFFQLSVGQVSDVVETRHGMHLLYISDKKTTVTPTVDDLLTSGILPGTLAQSKVTSAVAALSEDIKEKYNAQVLPGFGENDELTTDTVVFQIGEDSVTFGNLSAIFGERFISYVDRIRNDRDTLVNLMEQGMQDELSVRAAVEAGLLDEPGVRQTIENLVKRDRALQRINAIVEAEAVISDEAVRAKYEEVIDQLRRPELEGYVVVVHGSDDETTDPAQQARVQEQATVQAQRLLAQMEGGDLQAVKSFIDAQSDINATIEPVTRHVVNQATSPLAQNFDRAAATVASATGVSQPVPAGNDVIVAKVEGRHPGEPVPLEEVADRIRALLTNEKRLAVRQSLVQRAVEAGLVEFLPGADHYRGPQPDPRENESPSANDDETTSGQ